MIRLARVWYNAIADYHQDRALDHARRRDRALRKLERIERRHRLRENQREIEAILSTRVSGPEARAEQRKIAQHFRSMCSMPRAPLPWPEAPARAARVAEDTQ